MKKFIFISLFIELIILTSCKKYNNDVGINERVTTYEVSETNENLETENLSSKSKNETIVESTNEILKEIKKLIKFENEKPVSKEVDYAFFTDGTGQTPKTTLKVGDNFLGWTLTKLKSTIDVYSNGYTRQHRMESRFTGEKTIKATINYFGYIEGATTNYIEVEVSEDKYKKLLPMSIELYQKENYPVTFELRNEEKLIEILENRRLEGYITCELVIKDYYTLFVPTTGSPSATFVSINLENGIIKPSLEIDLDSSNTLKQKKDGNMYNITTTHDFNNNYSIHIFDETGSKLQTISLENEFFKGLSFEDINFDDYMDIIADIGRPQSETKALYTWDANSQRFNKVIFEGFDVLPYYEVYDGYIVTWKLSSDIKLKLVWKGNTLALASEEQYVTDIDKQPVKKYEFKNEDTSKKEINSDIIKLNEDLCTTEEELIYSFKIVDSDKTVSLITSEKYDYLICRIGKKDYIEFEFPENKANSWEQFTYSYYFRGGGKANLGVYLNHLLFETESYTYDLYYEYSAETESIEASIKIIDKKTNDEIALKADKNSLLERFWILQENNKIKIK